MQFKKFVFIPDHLKCIVYNCSSKIKLYKTKQTSMERRGKREAKDELAGEMILKQMHLKEKDVVKFSTNSCPRQRLWGDGRGLGERDVSTKW